MLNPLPSREHVGPRNQVSAELDVESVSVHAVHLPEAPAERARIGDRGIGE
jgi:hypothetical protein